MKTAEILSADEAGTIEEGARILRNGGLVAFPTETVYGLGADACNPLAVARIFEVKRRPQFDPLIVHIADGVDAARYGCVEDPVARRLIERFWPGPLTLVVSKTERVPAIVTAGLPTVGLRMPAHRAALALIRAAGTAVAAPSANPFGYVSPTEACHVAEQLGESVDLIIDGGRCCVGIESTVLSLAEPERRILRFGGVTADEIAAVVGAVRHGGSGAGTPQSPGQLVRHYATRTPLELVDYPGAAGDDIRGRRMGLLAFTAPEKAERFSAVEILSPSGDLREAAANLFSALRRLDALGLDGIMACRLPEHDLGVAIMDRLRRCAAVDSERPGQ